ncbi:MAG: hypothetical protein L6Q26_01180 [Anaerolineales bacterium]|nr:hypothetical protein [Anaerolineales bacterium]NUQ86023.1 hypothetical protein [Anaerolineales bacterium]
MQDSDLLKKYEPVLRFAKSERFFPMAVEPYLDRCHLLPSGPQGAVEMLLHLHESVRTRIGKLHSGEYYLRFVNDPLIDSDVWVWWGALSVVIAVAGWFVSGWLGVEIAAILSLTAAFVIFMQASPIRLRIIPAAFVTVIFITLEVAPIWFFLTPHPFISVQIEYLVLLPIYLIALFYLFVRTMKFIFDHIIPELPGVVMDMLSQATETVARKSYFQYAEMTEEERQPVYYGRVIHENEWTILQYHFFYAFNDWRLGANGINHHEGDWEMAAVYLKHDEPYAVLLSQHGSGAMELWKDVRRVRDTDGEETTHPLIYAGLGSHANYSKPEVIRVHRLFNEGCLQRFLYWTDGLLRFLFLLFNPSQRARQIALHELATHPATALTEETFASLRDEKDHYLVSLPMEIATGDGFRIGVDGDHKHEEVGKSTSYLKRVMSDREVTHPPSREWRQVLISEETDWVEFKGLWGVKSLLADESGPPGPKWGRPDQFFAVHPRKRWEHPLEWLRELESRR